MISNSELKFINFFETLQQKVFDNQTYQTDTSIIQIISQKYNETPLYLSAICFLRKYCTNPLDPILEQILQTYITDLPNSSRSFLSRNNPTNIRFLQYFLIGINNFSVADHGNLKVKDNESIFSKILDNFRNTLKDIGTTNLHVARILRLDCHSNSFVPKNRMPVVMSQDYDQFDYLSQKIVERKILRSVDISSKNDNLFLNFKVFSRVMAMGYYLRPSSFREFVDKNTDFLSISCLLECWNKFGFSKDSLELLFENLDNRLKFQNYFCTNKKPELTAINEASRIPSGLEVESIDSIFFNIPAINLAVRKFYKTMSENSCLKILKLTFRLVVKNSNMAPLLYNFFNGIIYPAPIKQLCVKNSNDSPGNSANGSICLTNLPHPLGFSSSKFNLQFTCQMFRSKKYYDLQNRNSSLKIIMFKIGHRLFSLEIDEAQNFCVKIYEQFQKSGSFDGSRLRKQTSASSLISLMNYFDENLVSDTEVKLCPVDQIFNDSDEKIWTSFTLKMTFTINSTIEFTIHESQHYKYQFPKSKSLSTNFASTFFFGSTLHDYSIIFPDTKSLSIIKMGDVACKINQCKTILNMTDNVIVTKTEDSHIVKKLDKKMAQYLENDKFKSAQNFAYDAQPVSKFRVQDFCELDSIYTRFGMSKLALENLGGPDVILLLLAKKADDINERLSADENCDIQKDLEMSCLLLKTLLLVHGCYKIDLEIDLLKSIFYILPLSSDMIHLLSYQVENNSYIAWFCLQILIDSNIWRKDVQVWQVNLQKLEKICTSDNNFPNAELLENFLLSLLNVAPIYIDYTTSVLILKLLQVLIGYPPDIKSIRIVFRIIKAITPHSYLEQNNSGNSNNPLQQFQFFDKHPLVREFQKETNNTNAKKLKNTLSKNLKTKRPTSLAVNARNGQMVKIAIRSPLDSCYSPSIHDRVEIGTSVGNDLECYNNIHDSQSSLHYNVSHKKHAYLESPLLPQTVEDIIEEDEIFVENSTFSDGEEDQSSVQPKNKEIHNHLLYNLLDLVRSATNLYSSDKRIGSEIGNEINTFSLIAFAGATCYRTRIAAFKLIIDLSDLANAETRNKIAARKLIPSFIHRLCHGLKNAHCHNQTNLNSTDLMEEYNQIITGFSKLLLSDFSIEDLEYAELHQLPFEIDALRVQGIYSLLLYMREMTAVLLNDKFTIGKNLQLHTEIVELHEKIFRIIALLIEKCPDITSHFINFGVSLNVMLEFHLLKKMKKIEKLRATKSMKLPARSAENSPIKPGDHSPIKQLVDQDKSNFDQVYLEKMVKLLVVDCLVQERNSDNKTMEDLTYTLCLEKNSRISTYNCIISTLSDVLNRIGKPFVPNNLFTLLRRVTLFPIYGAILEVHENEQDFTDFSVRSRVSKPNDQEWQKHYSESLGFERQKKESSEKMNDSDIFSLNLLAILLEICYEILDSKVLNAPGNRKNLNKLQRRRASTTLNSPLTPENINSSALVSSDNNIMIKSTTSSTQSGSMTLLDKFIKNFEPQLLEITRKFLTYLISTRNKVINLRYRVIEMITDDFELLSLLFASEASSAEKFYHFLQATLYYNRQELQFHQLNTLKTFARRFHYFFLTDEGKNQRNSFDGLSGSKILQNFTATFQSLTGSAMTTSSFQSQNSLDMDFLHDKIDLELSKYDNHLDQLLTVFEKRIIDTNSELFSRIINHHNIYEQHINDSMQFLALDAHQIKSSVFEEFDQIFNLDRVVMKNFKLLAASLTHERAPLFHPDFWSEKWSLDPILNVYLQRIRLKRCYEPALNATYFLKNAVTYKKKEFKEKNSASRIGKRTDVSSEKERQISYRRRYYLMFLSQLPLKSFNNNSKSSLKHQISSKTIFHTIDKNVYGRLIFNKEHNFLHFIPEDSHLIDSEASLQISDINFIVNRCFSLVDNSMEIFTNQGHTWFVEFYANNEDRDLFYVEILNNSRFGSKISENIVNIKIDETKSKLPALNNAKSVASAVGVAIDSKPVIDWISGKISNFQYLTLLNLQSRSYNDLMQYPVFPYVFRNFGGIGLDLSEKKNFRDLSRPIGLDGFYSVNLFFFN